MPVNVQPLWDFIHERHLVYLRRASGQPKPWTQDPILQHYRFTNAYRELDKVTVWIREHWREPHDEDKDLWFAMAVARLINWPESLKEIGYPAPWTKKRNRFVRRLSARKRCGEKVFTGVYMIRADRTSGGNKSTYLANKVLTPLWRHRKQLRPKLGDTLESFAARLQQCHDLGGFMVGQIIADTKHHGVLADAEDWGTWAASGPGSRRGMNLLLGREMNQPWKEGEWHRQLMWVLEYLEPRFQEQCWEPPDAQDVQNTLCEFSKYMKVKLGLGRPKQHYPGV